MKVPLQRLLYVALTVCALAIRVSAENWPMFGANAEHTSYTAKESAITKDTVRTLQLAWAQWFDTGFAAAPIVVDGVVYVGGWNGYFYAVDAKEGAVLWQTFVGMAAPPEKPQCQQPIGVTAQAVVRGDLVLVGGGDSAIYALKKDTGQQVWRTSLADPKAGAYIWSSLTLVNDVVYVGVASLGDCPLMRGLLARIDLKSPNTPLIRYLVPEGDIGAGVWSTPAFDAKTNTVYVTTGTGEQSVSAGVWGGTLLALDGTTLAIKRHYFLPTNSADEDIEWGSSPTIYTTSAGRKMIAATGKDGILYGLSADDLSFVYQVQVALGCICPECGCGSLSTPAFDGKWLYVGGGVTDPELFDTGSVYSINPDNGSVRWAKTIPGTIIAPVTVAGGLVFAGTTTGLNAFDAATGELVWDDAGHATMFTQPVVVNGTVYVTYLNGDLWALRPEGQNEDTSDAPSRGSQGSRR